MIAPLFAFLVMTGAASELPDDSGVVAIIRIETEISQQVQRGVLDPILGPGRGSAFAEIRILEVKREYEGSERFGEGEAVKRKSRVPDEVSFSTGASTGDGDLFSGFGFGDTAELRGSSRQDAKISSATAGLFRTANESSQAQRARQIKSLRTLDTRIHPRCDLRLTIVHDSGVPRQKLNSVRTVLSGVYQDGCGGGLLDVHLIAADFTAK